MDSTPSPPHTPEPSASTSAEETPIPPQDEDSIIPVSEDLTSSDTTSPPSEDELSTPRASSYQPISTSEINDLTALEEDYFPPPLPPRPTLEHSSSFLTLQNIHSATSSGASTPGLQAKATTAISLPEGVHAQQTDGASGGGSGSVTAAPSFSDSNSIVSLVPTLSAGDNDVESMLGEILGESEGRFSGMRARMSQVGDGFGDGQIEDEGWDESSDEEGLEEGTVTPLDIWRKRSADESRGIGCEVEGEEEAFLYFVFSGQTNL